MEADRGGRGSKDVPAIVPLLPTSSQSEVSLDVKPAISRGKRGSSRLRRSLRGGGRLVAGLLVVG